MPGESILIVDDDLSLREFLGILLARDGYAVRAAASGEAAMAAVETEWPDLVLTDLVLPDGTGRDVAAQTAGLQPAPRLLFMSGHGRDEALESVILRAADPLLTKPFTARELLSQVADALAR